MNHETDNIPRFDDPAREREWLVQENAMRRERLHLNPAGDDARSQRYRMLARALRTESPNTLPADFAEQVSALAAARSQVRVPALALERWLTFALASVLLLAALVVTLIYGASWWPAFAVLRPAPLTAQWLMALMACIGVSWLLSVMPRLARPVS